MSFAFKKSKIFFICDTLNRAFSFSWDDFSLNCNQRKSKRTIKRKENRWGITRLDDILFEIKIIIFKTFYTISVKIGTFHSTFVNFKMREQRKIRHSVGKKLKQNSPNQSNSINIRKAISRISSWPWRAKHIQFFQSAQIYFKAWGALPHVF